MRLFLGGTCNESKWREKLIPLLEKEGIKYFNPVVPDWTPECQRKEDQIEQMNDTVELYVITSEMTGVFSIAEAVQASNRKPASCIFMVIDDGFTQGQIKSLNAVKKIIQGNCAFVAESLQSLMVYLKANTWL